MTFNINRPTRRSWLDWQKDLSALSGQRDVSKDDMLHKMEQVVLAQDPARAYAEAEMADGRHREQFPNEIDE